MVVVGAEEYCEEGVGRVELGEGGFVGHVGGEEGGDGVEDVGQSPGLGGVPCPAVLAGFAGPILAQLALPTVPWEIRGAAVCWNGEPAEDALSQG